MCGLSDGLERGKCGVILRDHAHLAQSAAMSTRADRISALLRQHFTPTLLRVTDDSAHHAGHAGASPGGETHYSVLLVAEAFAGASRVARSRAVHAALDAEFTSGLHALALTLRSPAEHAKIAS
jgi:BolA protein